TVTNLATLGSSMMVAGELVRGQDGLFYAPVTQGIEGLTGGVAQVGRGTVNYFTFDATNQSPNWLMQAPDGNFYGTSGGGYSYSLGYSNYGSIFRFSTNGTITTLAVFNGTNGSIPHGLLRTPDGTFYGTTFYGGIGFSNSGPYDASSGY